ncbi:MAG: HAD hydrolase-like protein [Thermococcus sp.]|uniref:HAD family hydrolase n=1 Tax=Thermococcus sp. TaxID=35749 RepID=UPI001D2E87B0|nr:HAD family hydrolase [Thermococcus sp.]MBO8173641.1 HAD hydrolase-like protein [Thermococcus sp.]
MKAAIIWDFDGVLVFTPHEEAWKKAAEHYGVRDFDHDFFVNYVSGKPRYEGADNILRLKGIYERFGAYTVEERQKLLHEFAEFKNKLVNEMFDRGEYGINNEAIKFLIETKKAGVKHALASASKNAPKLAQKIKLNIDGEEKTLLDLFDVNVSGLAPTKKAVFKRAIQELRSKFPELEVFIIVEDSPTGVRVAKELGIFTLGYEREAKLDADLTFKDFKEINWEKILELLKKKGE